MRSAKPRRWTARSVKRLEEERYGSVTSRDQITIDASNLVLSVRANIRLVEQFRHEHLRELAERAIDAVSGPSDLRDRLSGMSRDATAEDLLDVIVDDANAEIDQLDSDGKIRPDEAGAAKALLAMALAKTLRSPS
jgi:hypothetical protein